MQSLCKDRRESVIFGNQQECFWERDRRIEKTEKQTRRIAVMPAWLRPVNPQKVNFDPAIPALLLPPGPPSRSSRGMVCGGRVDSINHSPKLHNNIQILPPSTENTPRHTYAYRTWSAFFDEHNISIIDNVASLHRSWSKRKPWALRLTAMVARKIQTLALGSILILIRVNHPPCPTFTSSTERKSFVAYKRISTWVHCSAIRTCISLYSGSITLTMNRC